jgi:hypothetical protein
LFEVRDVDVSIATVSRTMRRLAISHKDILKEARERDEFVQAWQVEYGDIPAEAFLWLDELPDDRPSVAHRRGRQVGHRTQDREADVCDA